MFVRSRKPCARPSVLSKVSNLIGVFFEAWVPAKQGFVGWVHMSPKNTKILLYMKRGGKNPPLFQTNINMFLITPKATNDIAIIMTAVG